MKCTKCQEDMRELTQPSLVSDIPKVKGIFCTNPNCVEFYRIKKKGRK